MCSLALQVPQERPYWVCTYIRTFVYSMYSIVADFILKILHTYFVILYVQIHIYV